MYWVAFIRNLNAKRLEKFKITVYYDLALQLQVLFVFIKENKLMLVQFNYKIPEI